MQPFFHLPSPWSHFQTHKWLYYLCGFFLLLASDAFAITDRYRVMWRDDPATTMVVGWNQRYCNVATLYYDIEDHGKDYRSYQFRTMPEVYNTSKGMRNCFARLRGLLPNTVYYFVLVDNDGVSRPMSFKTASNNPLEKISLIAGGDSRNHREARRDANKLVSKLRPTAILFGGDMTANDTESEWWEWLDDWQLTIGSDDRLFPIIVARGNHEEDNQVLVDLFDVPHPSAYYGLTLGGNLLRVYTLNTMIACFGDQRDWLESDLAAHQNVIWKLAQYHHPMLPHTTNKQDRKELIQYWATLFYKYGMDMAVECDAHVVKSTWPIRPEKGFKSQDGFVRDDQRGTVYIGEGCWGAPLRQADDNRKWTRNSGSFNQFAWILLDRNDVEVRIVQTDMVARVAEVDPYRPFEPPVGLVVWSPSNGDVIRLSKNLQLQEQVVYQPTFEPMFYSERSSSRLSISAPGTSIELAPSPVQPIVLHAEPDGTVNVPYEVPKPGLMELVLIDSNRREVLRSKFQALRAGFFQKAIDCHTLAPGEYQLVVKCNDQTVVSYRVRR